MDYTPPTEEYMDSGHVSASFDTSSMVYESTPKNETESIQLLLNNNSKKRKAHFCDIKCKKLNLLQTCLQTPQASSTLNDSLTKEFENFRIEYNSCCNIEDGPSHKFLRNNGSERIVTPPSTPESHLRVFDCTPKKSSSFQKCSSTHSIPSPLKEQHEILYPNLKPLDHSRKPLTPQKFKEKLERIGQNSTPLNKIVVFSRSNNLFNQILSNMVIMEKIFSYLSNGDLFRLSMVCRSFRNALDMSTKSFQRYQIYRDSHAKNKENYKITPPSSPETNFFNEGSVSPNRMNFTKFIELGNSLKENQSLIKCPKCQKPSIVEKSIAQCQDASMCGYIFCQLCDSFSVTQEGFFDRCRKLSLGVTVTNKRRRLEDLSNCSLDFNSSSLLNSTSNYNGHSSGYFSSYETSHTPSSVKRDLTRSFDVGDSPVKPMRALFDNNRSAKSITAGKTPKSADKKKSVVNVAPVVQSRTNRKAIEIVEPSSPPSVKTYAACSTESKRNLKRLTR